MVVNSEDVMNIMGGMENSSGIKLNDHKRKLKNRFEICKKLGQGTYGKVQLGINKETQERVAIKTIKKSKIETEADLIRIRREIQIMSSVQHPNIIHIYEVFENKEKMVLVMEMANGGELYDFLSDKKCLGEHEARRIFRQISTAVFYCHKHKICHRDLKLENILLDENGSAKIADFGLSNVFGGESLLNTFCGSPLYASPEIVKGSPYEGPEVDCWSLGVLLYTLVYGAMPFDGSNFKRLVRQITTGDYYEPKDASRASSLIRSMLTVQPEMRAKIEDICSHWWVNETYPQSCLTEAEYLASLTPVRLDLLLGVSPCPKIKETPKIGQTEKPLSIEEIDNEDKGEGHLKHSEDIPKSQDDSDNNVNNMEMSQIEPRPLDQNGYAETTSNSPDKGQTPVKEVFTDSNEDSGVMIESIHDTEERKMSVDEPILELEKTPSENIPTTISLIQEPATIPPPPPPIFEAVRVPSPELPPEELIEEPPSLNGFTHDEPMVLEELISEPIPEPQEETMRDKSPTPPPTPPPLPPPAPVQNPPKEKLKINLEPAQCKSPPNEISKVEIPKTAPTTPEKRENRDSKVIKAAQYWNNFIGDVISKNKSPDSATTTQQPKPKKIVAAGVGPKGMNDLKTTFENGKDTLERRPARKSSIGGCNPGLKVTDAKNVFEIKAQQPPTPVIYRRNSGAKDGLKTKWTKPKPRPTTPALENEIALQQIKILQVEPPSEATKPDEALPHNVKPMPCEAPPSPRVVPKGSSKNTQEKDLPTPQSESSFSPEPLIQKALPATEAKKAPESLPLEPSQEKIKKGPPLEVTESMNNLPQYNIETPQKPATPSLPKNKLVLSMNIPQSPPPSIPIEESLLTTAPIINDKPKPVLRQVKSLDTPSTNESVSVVKELLYTDIPSNNESLDDKKILSKTEDPSSPSTMKSKEKTTELPSKLGTKPRPSKLNKPKAVQHFENKINSIQQPQLGGKKNESIKSIEPEKPPKGVEAVNVVTPPIGSPIAEPTVSSVPPLDMKCIKEVDASNYESSLKMIGSPVSSSTFSSTPPPMSKPPPPPPSILQTPSQIQAPLLKNSNIAPPQEKYVPIAMEKDDKPVYHIPVQVESPSICEEKRSNYYPSNSLNRRRWGSRKKRMSTGYSDSSMSDDDGSFFQYPSGIGLQKQISLGKHGLETAPMFRLRKTRPPFTLQREPSFSSDGEDELEDDGFREMTAENLFSTLLTRVKSLTRRIHDEHEEHINKWHQNQRIVNHPLNPGDTHARLERSALRNSIKRLPMNKRPTYEETPLPSSIPSENLDLACGVSVTSKTRSRPGYLPHPNVERIIPINLVNSHEKFDFFPSSSSPPIRRMAESPGEMPFGDEDRQRRVSRFLRPDFYDTPKEDSIYAKMKEMEEEDRKKSRFLKKIQARNASENIDILSPLSPGSQDGGLSSSPLLTSATSNGGEGCEPIQLRKTRGELEHISEEDIHSNTRLSSLGQRRHHPTPLLKRGGHPGDSFSQPHISPSYEPKDNLSKMLTRRSISSELFGGPEDDFFHHPRAITRRSISRDLHDTVEDLRLRNNAALYSPGTRSSRNNPLHTSTINRSDWRRTSVPERGKDFKTLPRNYVNFD